MITFNPNVNTTASSNRVQKQNFGSFPVPRHCGESQRLSDKVYLGLIPKTPDNIESLKTAFKTGQQVCSCQWVSIRNDLKDIAKKWDLNPEDLTK